MLAFAIGLELILLIRHIHIALEQDSPSPEPDLDGSTDGSEVPSERKLQDAQQQDLHWILIPNKASSVDSPASFAGHSSLPKRRRPIGDKSKNPSSSPEQPPSATPLQSLGRNSSQPFITSTECSSTFSTWYHTFRTLFPRLFHYQVFILKRKKSHPCK